MKHFHQWHKKQIVYANSEDQLSTGRPPNFREIQTSPLHSCQNGLEAVCIHSQNIWSIQWKPSVTSLVWTSVHQTTNWLKFSLFNPLLWHCVNKVRFKVVLIVDLRTDKIKHLKMVLDLWMFLDWHSAFLINTVRFFLSFFFFWWKITEKNSWLPIDYYLEVVSIL